MYMWVSMSIPGCTLTLSSLYASRRKPLGFCTFSGPPSDTSHTVFSLGDYRRTRLGPSASLPSDYFFPGKRSPESEGLRNQVRGEMTAIILEYFQREKGQVAIYDANNTTVAERAYLREMCAQHQM